MENDKAKLKGIWDAEAFFRGLCERNRLAREHGFAFARVSGLDGFEEALNLMQESPALLCVSDSSDGHLALNNSPRTRRVKTVLMAMRHGVGDMEARAQCIGVMRELFRQFMSSLCRERVRLQQNMIYIDERVSFNEVDRYFFNEAACVFFQVAVDVCTDLIYNPDEWTE